MNSRMKLIDLHTHTLASDGTDSPSALVQKAHAAGLAAVAVTDHDTRPRKPDVTWASR